MGEHLLGVQLTDDCGPARLVEARGETCHLRAMKMNLAPRLEPEPVSITDTTLPVRWLAASCGLPSGEPLPHLASALLAQPEQTQLLAHIANLARNPEPGSSFARNVAALADMSDREIVAALKDKGYDGLIYLDGAGLVADCFFQRRDDELHVFAGWVAERRRDGKLMAIVGFDVLAYASAQPGIVRARVGSGRADRVLAPLRAVGAGLHWRLRRGGWVDFSQGEP